MLTLREAAQQALEALKLWDTVGEQPSWHRRKERQDAITALRAALAEQPVQEPVAWRWTESNGKHWFDWRTDWTHHDRANELGFHVEYAYAAPPQRKPLTEEEIQAIWAKTFESGSSANTFARAIERAHGIGADDA